MPLLIPPTTIDKSDAEYMLDRATKALRAAADELGYQVAPGWHLELDITLMVAEDDGEWVN